MCAELNRVGLVDGVMTSDGDAFLYGASTVIRNLSSEKVNETTVSDNFPLIESINIFVELCHRDVHNEGYKREARVGKE